MTSTIKCLMGILLLGVLAAFVKPISAQAADARCLRIKLIVDETNPTTLSYDYHPSTKALTTSTQYVPISWYDESPNGRWLAMKLISPEKGVEFIRFFERSTQRSIDYELGNAFNPNSTQGGRLIDSGWSPDSQYFAMPVMSTLSDVTENWLLIFGRDRSLMTQVPFDSQGGYSLWSWLPDSKRIVMTQPDPDKVEGDKMYYTVQIVSISGSSFEGKLAESLYVAPALFSSPDGQFVAVLSTETLSVMNTGTGELVTIPQKIFSEQTSVDVAWSSDSQSLLYTVLAEPEEAYRFYVMRYSVETQDSEVLIEDAGIPYLAGSYTALGIPAPREGAMLISQPSEEAVHFYLIDAQTGELQEVLEEPVNELSLNAMSEWSPLGDVLWVSANTTMFFRPETMTTVTLPEGSTLVSMYNSLLGRWSENGEWVSVLVQNSDTTRLLVVINTRTGELRTIPVETLPDYEVFYGITSNTGRVLIVQGASLNLVLEDGSLTQLTDSLYWSGIEYGNNGAVWSPDGTKLALLEPSLEDSNLSIVKIFQSNSTLIDSIDNISAAASSIESLNWIPCE